MVVLTNREIEFPWREIPITIILLGHGSTRFYSDTTRGAFSLLSLPAKTVGIVEDSKNFTTSKVVLWF